MKTEITEAHGVLLFSIDTTPKNLKKWLENRLHKA
jgi:hypothetical protein